MPFRSIVATPEELARIAAAFEEAWNDIEARIDPLSAPGQRERLAAIVAELWADHPLDLAAAAVRRFNETAAKLPKAPVIQKAPKDS
ncbi:hypothetical protein FG93_05288 [Bosea sp. LC85]|uniref:hypothetical protein n=1 Tax=Bosea sp. LC85 TaxID=1502851 RepID=UPI0004E3F2FF|nr:hypothetical protein [Bosea sp. LC85]KFC64692.1 hypothetical protein FG93_05288 [Bosea sp. LC85]